MRAIRVEGRGVVLGVRAIRVEGRGVGQHSVIRTHTSDESHDDSMPMSFELTRVKSIVASKKVAVSALGRNG